MDISARRRKLAELRRDLAALGNRLAVQQTVVTEKIALLDNLRLGLNLHHGYEASLERQRHAQRLGFAAEVEAEQVEQQMLRAAAESLRTGN